MDRIQNSIVCADDFGMSPLGNTRILSLAQEGKINAVSVLVYGAYSDDDISLLCSLPLKLYLHLDISSYILVEEGGRDSVLKRGFIFLWEYFFSQKYSTSRIEKEWESQILLFQKHFERLPDGLNTHQHLHFFPSFFNVVTQLAGKHGIGYIRLGKNFSGVLDSVGIILSLFRFFNKRVLQKAGKETSDFLLSFDWLSSSEDREIEKYFNTKKKAEIIFHPLRDKDFVYLSQKKFFEK